MVLWPEISTPYDRKKHYFQWVIETGERFNIADLTNVEGITLGEYLVMKPTQERVCKIYKKCA